MTSASTTLRCHLAPFKVLCRTLRTHWRRLPVAPTTLPQLSQQGTLTVSNQMPSSGSSSERNSSIQLMKAIHRMYSSDPLSRHGYMIDSVVLTKHRPAGVSSNPDSHNGRRHTRADDMTTYDLRLRTPGSFHKMQELPSM